MRAALIAATFIALATPAGAQTPPPFCHVSDFGQQTCTHYSLQSCQMTQRMMGGICAANAARAPAAISPAVTTSPPIRDPATSIAEGFALGQGIRQSRERHNAEMRRLAAVSEPEALQVIYRCEQSGQVVFLTSPAVGCVVIGITP